MGPQLASRCCRLSPWPHRTSACTPEAATCRPYHRGLASTGWNTDTSCQDALGCTRERTHQLASCSHSTLAPCRRAAAHRGRDVAARALFDPPPFSPDKLTVALQPGTTALTPAPPRSRRYTLTHNDITGSLRLTIGPDYNEQQISGFYTRLLRDEVTAEWCCTGGRSYALHVYCHVSGEEKWLAPPLLRNYIFRREMTLVLDTLVYADRQLIEAHPDLSMAEVYIHFQSSVEDLDTVECWGVLGNRSTWAKGPTSILARVIHAVVGWPPQLKSMPADLSIDLPATVSQRASLTALGLAAAAQRQQQQEALQEAEPNLEAAPAAMMPVAVVAAGAVIGSDEAPAAAAAVACVEDELAIAARGSDAIAGSSSLSVSSEAEDLVLASCAPLDAAGMGAGSSSNGHGELVAVGSRSMQQQQQHPKANGTAVYANGYRQQAAVDGCSSVRGQLMAVAVSKGSGSNGVPCSALQQRFRE